MLEITVDPTPWQQFSVELEDKSLYITVLWRDSKAYMSVANSDGTVYYEYYRLNQNERYGISGLRGFLGDFIIGSIKDYDEFEVLYYIEEDEVGDSD